MSDDEQPSRAVASREEPPYRETSPQRDSRPQYEQLTSIGRNKFFPERYEYTSKFIPFCGYTRDGCVIDATMTILHAQGIYPTEDELVNRFESTPGEGFYPHEMPSALQSFRRSARYTCKNISSVDDLKAIIDTTGLPVASRLAKEGKMNHRIVVEKIENHSEHERLICILDGRESYKVTQEDWLAVWANDDIVPDV